MSTEFPNLESLLFWITERERVRTRREAGEPPPWSTDPLLATYRFCNANVQDDRVSRAIFDTFTRPYANHPGLVVALAVCRFTNAPEVFEAVRDCLVPFDPRRFVAIMEDRAARGLPLERRAYVIPGGQPGELKAKSLTRNLFIPLANAIESIRPRPGDTCEQVFKRLQRFPYLEKGFITAQIVRDLKQVEPLRSALDWRTFVRSGPGSQRGVNRILGATTTTEIEREHPESEWRRLFEKIVALAAPQAAEHGIELDAQSWQNVFCETDKFLRFRSGDLGGARRYSPDGKTPTARIRRPKSEPAPLVDAHAPSIIPSPPPLPPPRPYPRGLFAQLAAPFIIPTLAKSDSSLRLTFDIESDELLDDATKVHCVVVTDVDSDQIDEYGPDQIDAALAHLKRADCLIGHNIASYDLPLLRRLHNWVPSPSCVVVDTLIAARLILPHLSDLDTEIQARTGASLGKLHGRYSLEAFGVRLGISKTGVDIDFSKWSPELQQRCVGDVTLTKALWRFLQPDGYSRQALELEHRVAAICNQITADGVPFDQTAAKRLREQWEVRRNELEALLRQQFPNTKNFNSRLQIAKLLEARGWTPEQRTEKTNKPKINDELLERLPMTFPEFAGLAEHYILGRRLGQLTNGKQAWLANVGPDGRIHGGVIHVGTPHSRAKHLQPNLAQVPNPKRGKPFATESRALFRADGWVFVTCDQANLQDRVVGHYLHEFDNGAYAKAFLDSVDMHWQSAIALGLIPAGTERDKTNAIHTVIREGSKSFRYGFLFGAGAKRAGEIIAEIVRAVHRIDPTNDLCRRRFDGGEARKRFMAATPGLQQLRRNLDRQHDRHGWVLGLDGRRVPTGAQYKALNRVVTAGEAIICKRWLARVFDELRERFRYGQDGDVVIVAWVHDELVCCCRPELAEQVGEIMARHAKEAGEHYDFKVPLDAEFKIGRSWAGEPIASAASADAASIVPEPAGSAGNGADRDLEPIAGDADNGADLEPLAATSQIEFAAKGAGTLFAAATEVSTGKRPPPQSDAVPPWVELDNDLPQRSGNGHATDGFDGFPDKNPGGKILCPFHDDHNPSLHIYPGEDDPHYWCFVCHARGHLDDLEVDWQATLKSPDSSPTDGDNERNLARAHELWDKAKPIAGTLAERYLAETRGIDVGALPPNIDNALRFHPRCPFGDKRHPCLIALFRDIETGERAGIHRTALTPDAQKIERRMFGQWPRPRAIKLWPADDKLYVGEGIETVLAAATRLGMRPAWALASTSYLEKLPAISGIAELTILVDHDGHGEAAAEACCQIWKTAGRRVRRLRTQEPALNDFNDLVLAKLRGAS